MTAADVAAITGARTDAIMLPKDEGAPSILQLDTVLRSESARDASLPAVLPIATETPAAILTLGSYREVKDRLLGRPWVAEDLHAELSPPDSRPHHGSSTAPPDTRTALPLS